MSPKIRTTLAALALSSTLAMAPGAAWALDATALIERYTKLAETQGQEFRYSKIEETGSGFMIHAPVWTLAPGVDVAAVTSTFSDIEENSDGSVVIGSIDVKSVASGSKKTKVVFENVSMKDLQIPAPGSESLASKMAYYSSFSTGEGTVFNDGRPVVSIGSSRIELSPYDETAPMKMKMEIADVAADLINAPDPKMHAGLKDLGYGTKFSGRMDMVGDWSIADGLVNLTQFDFTIDNVATLSMPFSMGGYTKEVMEMMQKQQAMAKGDPKAAQAAGLMMLQKLDFRGASVSIKDDSITERALKLAGKKMNQPPESIAAGAPMMIGLGMQKFQMPELTQMISNAVGAFLQNPGTLTVSANPAKPVNFMELVLASQANPQELVKLLNLKAEASN